MTAIPNTARAGELPHQLLGTLVVETSGRRHRRLPVTTREPAAFIWRAPRASSKAATLPRSRRSGTRCISRRILCRKGLVVNPSPGRPGPLGPAREAAREPVYHLLGRAVGTTRVLRDRLAPRPRQGARLIGAKPLHHVPRSPSFHKNIEMSRHARQGGRGFSAHARLLDEPDLNYAVSFRIARRITLSARRTLSPTILALLSSS